MEPQESCRGVLCAPAAAGLRRIVHTARAGTGWAAIAAAVLTLVLLAPPAEARCWWNGYRWHCTRYHHHYVGYPAYPYYGYGYYPYYYRPHYRPYYACLFPFCW